MPDEMRFKASKIWQFDLNCRRPSREVHDAMRAAREWCEENLDPLHWEYQDRVVSIYDETAATAFKLRWC